MKFLRLLPLALIGFAVMPQANAADIKQDNINSCVSGAVKYKVADKNTATKLCTCTIGVRSKMTIGQMWEKRDVSMVYEVSICLHMSVIGQYKAC